MRLSTLPLVSFVMLSGLLPLSAMNNADLIKLKNADLSDETILLSINKERADYDTSPSGLVELKKAGLSEAIIQRVLSRAPGSEGSDAALAESSSSAAASAAKSELFAIESPSIAPPLIDPLVGHEYFTRFSFNQEDGKYLTTNYARGSLVPINTAVKVLAMSGDNLVIKRLDTNIDIKVENVKKYSGKTIAEIARLMLADEKTPVDKLNPILATAIRSGEMRKGMTKEQVLMARGFPPAHETPSVESDRWVYWSSRFIKQTILFANGRLVEGRGIL